MIRLNDVSKSWDAGRTFAVREINFHVREGEILALLGGSGSGKSTTLRMINRLIEPTSGCIEVGGQDILKQDAVQLRRRVGYVFQSVGLFPHLTVAENVGIIPRLLGHGRGEWQAQAEHWLELVHLPAEQYAHRYPAQLSGGERQRVGFARALAGEARVILLDEPFGALDPVTRDDLQVEFLNLHQQLRFTAVLVTHDMAEALLLADRIAILKAGRLIRVGTPAELLKRPGDDYVSQLLETPRRHSRRLRELEHE